MDAPVISLISLIFAPPFPMSDPHWDAGTTRRNVIGGRGTVVGETRFERSWKEKDAVTHLGTVKMYSKLADV